MENRPGLPRHPRGTGSAADPSVATEHGSAEPERKNYAGSSRSSSFGLFRRQPSRSDLRAPPASAQSSRSNAGDSYYGVFDNISVGTTVTGLESPQQAHDNSAKIGRMLKAAEKYRKSIEAMSDAAVEFGNTLYECAATKGAASAHTSLPDHTVDTDSQAAGGSHLSISNHANISASSVISNVEEPLGHEFKVYKQRIANKEQEFKTSLRTKLAALREADIQRQKDARKRRDSGSYRSSSLDSTYQIDDINRSKTEFLGDIHAMSTEFAEKTHAAIASTVTAEIEVFEGIARKGWTGGGLDGLSAGCPDPFESTHPRATSLGTTSPVKSAPSSDSSLAPPLHSSHPKLNGNRPRSSTQRSAEYDGSFDLSKHSDGSPRTPVRGSANSFSVLPPGRILPTSTDDAGDDTDDDNDVNDNRHKNQSTPKPEESSSPTTKVSDSSDTSDIGNLTSTRRRLRGLQEQPDMNQNDTNQHDNENGTTQSDPSINSTEDGPRPDTQPTEVAEEYNDGTEPKDSKS